jgi:hypothetical protein
MKVFSDLKNSWKAFAEDKAAIFSIASVPD